MHFMTLYYKNLCEQLQQKINLLEQEVVRVSKESPAPPPFLLNTNMTLEFETPEEAEAYAEKFQKEVPDTQVTKEPTEDPRYAALMQEREQAKRERVEHLKASLARGYNPGGRSPEEREPAEVKKEQKGMKLLFNPIQTLMGMTPRVED